MRLRAVGAAVLLLPVAAALELDRSGHEQRRGDGVQRLAREQGASFERVRRGQSAARELMYIGGGIKAVGLRC